MAKDIVIKTKKFIANKLLNRKQFVRFISAGNRSNSNIPYFEIV